MIIFRSRSNGEKLPASEKAKYDQRVYVAYQACAWTDETVCAEWIKNVWSPNRYIHSYTYMHTHELANTLLLVYSITGQKVLLQDGLRAQCRETTKTLLGATGTLVVVFPPDCTAELQPVDQV